MTFLLRRTQFTIIIIAVFFIFLTGLAFSSIEDTITKSFSVEPGGTLTLESDIGSIEVQAVEGNTLEVEVIRKVKTTSEERAKKILEDYEIEFSQSGKDVYIKAEYERHGWQKFWDSVSKRLRVKYIVSVPRIYNLDLKTKGGSISVEDVEGKVSSRTSGGSLYFDHILGDVNGRTSGGSIKIGEVDGNIVVHTSGGSIRINIAKGDVDAHTSGGSITVEEVAGTIRARTSGGSVKAYISHQPESNCRLTTSGGSITVYMEEGIGVDVNARTSGGRVQTEFPVTLRGTIKKRSLKAKINGGGPELYLRTSGGSIYLRKK